MKTLDFSIIVPCYNQENFLAETLQSVQNQTLKNWECIIVNDGSTDSSEQIINEFCAQDSRFIKINQANKGLAATRNNGIMAASGTYILPLDGDDKIGADYLELALHEFQKNPQLKLVYAQAEFFATKNEYWPLPEYTYRRILFVNCIYCSAIFRKSDYLKTEGYDVNMRHGYEDWEFWLQLLSPEDQVYRLNSVQFYYRQRDQSMISFLNEKNKRRDMETYIMEKHREKYPPLLRDGFSMENFLEISSKLEELKSFKKSVAFRTVYKVEKSIQKIFRAG